MHVIRAEKGNQRSATEQISKELIQENIPEAKEDMTLHIKKTYHHPKNNPH